MAVRIASFSKITWYIHSDYMSKERYYLHSLQCFFNLDNRTASVLSCYCQLIRACRTPRARIHTQLHATFTHAK
jgi:hypothetical protein